jgi:prevent-host-death family protein
MATVTTTEARTHLSRLLRRVEGGEEIVILRGNLPVARLVPLEGRQAAREMGFATDDLEIADDFDAPLPPDVLDAFGSRDAV